MNIDCFAGGGGASTGLEQAGIKIDIAINHDPAAILMHKRNVMIKKELCLIKCNWNLHNVMCMDVAIIL